MFTCCVWSELLYLIYVMIYESCTSMARNAIDWFREHNYKPPLRMTFFNWDWSHTRACIVHTRTKHTKRDIDSIYRDNDFWRSHNVSNFNSLQSKAQIFIGLESFWSFFFSPIFFFGLRGRTVAFAIVVVVIVYHYKFQPITDLIMPDIIWLYIFCSFKVKFNVACFMIEFQCLFVFFFIP